MRPEDIQDALNGVDLKKIEEAAEPFGNHMHRAGQKKNLFLKFGTAAAGIAVITCAALLLPALIGTSTHTKETDQSTNTMDGIESGQSTDPDETELRPYEIETDGIPVITDENGVPVLPDEKAQEIRQAFCEQYRGENTAASAESVRIRWYFGKIRGMYAVWAEGDWLAYPEAEWEETFYGYTFRYPVSSSMILLYSDGAFYSLSVLYKTGFLGRTEIGELYHTCVTMEALPSMPIQSPELQTSPFVYTQTGNSTVVSFDFPHNTYGISENNYEYYSNTDFGFSIKLPANWTLADADAENDTAYGFLDGTKGLLSRVLIRNAEGKTVGMIGYMSGGTRVFDLGNPRETYSLIASGNHLLFLMPEDSAARPAFPYRVVKASDEEDTAVTEVYYSAKYLSAYRDQATELYNPAILIRNCLLMRYVAIEFDKDSVDVKTVEEIASGVSFCSSSWGYTEIPPKPEDAGLDFWLTDKITNGDFEGYEKMMNISAIGGNEYLGKGYTTKTDTGYVIRPDAYISYVTAGYPDAWYDGWAVTEIKITDPAVSVYGLHVNDAPESFDRVFAGMGFTIDGEYSSTGKIHCASKGRFHFIYSNGMLRMIAASYNHSGLTYD